MGESDLSELCTRSAISKRRMASTLLLCLLRAGARVRSRVRVRVRVSVRGW